MSTTKSPALYIETMARLSGREDAAEAIREIRYSEEGGSTLDAIEAIEAVGESKAIVIWAGTIERMGQEQRVADSRQIRSLVRQDQASEAEDPRGPRAMTGVEEIKRWRRAAGEAGDLDLIATLDRLGDGVAAQMYDAARVEGSAS